MTEEELQRKLEILDDCIDDPVLYCEINKAIEARRAWVEVQMLARFAIQGSAFQSLWRIYKKEYEKVRQLEKQVDGQAQIIESYQKRLPVWVWRLLAKVQ